MMLPAIQLKVDTFPEKFSRFVQIERWITQPFWLHPDLQSSLFREYDNLDKFFGFSASSQFRMQESEGMKRVREKKKKFDDKVTTV